MLCYLFIGKSIIKQYYMSKDSYHRGRCRGVGTRIRCPAVMKFDYNEKNVTLKTGSIIPHNNIKRIKRYKPTCLCTSITEASLPDGLRRVNDFTKGGPNVRYLLMQKTGNLPATQRHLADELGL